MTTSVAQPTSTLPVSRPLIFSWLVSHASPSVSPEPAKGLKTPAELCSSTSAESSTTTSPRTSSSKTSKAYSAIVGGATFRTIITTLTELGYRVEWKVLNSKDYGVPQHRERVYIVGHFGDEPGPQIFSAGGQGNPHSTVGLTTETAVARTLTAGGNSGGNHSGMTILELTGARSQSQRLYDPAGLSPTLSTGGADTGGAEVPKINIPPLIRRLTPTEFERLQGFPDGWTVGSDTQRYKQGGNAVTVPVVKAVTLALYKEGDP